MAETRDEAMKEFAAAGGFGSTGRDCGNVSRRSVRPGLSHCALLTLRKPLGAGFSIDIAANLSAHSALA